MAKKSKEGIVKEIEIPEGVETNVERNIVSMKKGDNELKKKIVAGVDVAKEENKIVLKISRARRPDKKNLGTAEGHVKNMVKGLTEGFEYELEICNVHFPMTVDFDKAKKEIVINNLLGEKAPRKLKVSDKVEIDIQAPKITVKSYDIEAAGQTAANLEIVSKVRNRDRNKFQDGIFITKKPRKEFL